MNLKTLFFLLCISFSFLTKNNLNCGFWEQSFIYKISNELGRLKQLRLQLKNFWILWKQLYSISLKTLYWHLIRRTPKDPKTWTSNVRQLRKTIPIFSRSESLTVQQKVGCTRTRLSHSGLQTSQTNRCSWSMSMRTKDFIQRQLESRRTRQNRMICLSLNMIGRWD